MRPGAAPLAVKLETPAASAPAGTDVPITVSVVDDAGNGVVAEVALYAVDEGTLRVTGYSAPDPTSGLFPRLPPAFAWEDLRRTLVSRVALPLLPGAGGDGPGKSDRSRPRDEQERFDPTPLWTSALVTDASGTASAVLHLPERPAQYRIVAVAIDAGIRQGSAEHGIVAAMPVVVRPVLPPFATVGDRFQAAAFVHNTEDAAADVVVTVVVDGQRREPSRVHLGPKSETRVTEWVDAAHAGKFAIRFEAKSEHGAASVEARVPVQSRGRQMQSEVVGAVSGSREISVALPGAADAPLTLTLAAHPFVAFDTALEELRASQDEGTEPLASSLIGLAAYGRLDTGKRPTSAGPAELAARAASAITRLLALQGPAGGFGAFSASDAPDPYLSPYALHALLSARRAGFAVPAAQVERAVGFLGQLVRGSVYIDDRGHDDLAFALRVLAEAGPRDDERNKALFDQRDQLSPFGLAQLALAMDAADRRRDTLALDGARRVLAPVAEERLYPGVLRWYDGSARMLGAVLEAALATEAANPQAAALASKLLTARASGEGAWWSKHETSHALAALAAYAATLSDGDPIAPRIFLDGVPLGPGAEDASVAWFAVPSLGGTHTLRIQVQGSAFFALSGRWVVPLGPDDTVARGDDAALHRVLEDATGKPLGPDAHVHLGDLVRVRLFVYSEHGTPPYLALRDRLAGGLEPIDAAHETSPRESLWALLGMGPDDDAVDVRGHHASRSLGDIAQRSFHTDDAVFYLPRLPAGLREYTYGVRATAAGTFVLPPAELTALYAPRFSARSAVSTITVDP